MGDSYILYVGYIPLKSPRHSECYPLVMTNIAIENGPVEIVDFSINSMVIFHIVM